MAKCILAPAVGIWMTFRDWSWRDLCLGDGSCTASPLQWHSSTKSHYRHQTLLRLLLLSGVSCILLQRKLFYIGIYFLLLQFAIYSIEWYTVSSDATNQSSYALGTLLTIQAFKLICIALNHLQGNHDDNQSSLFFSKNVYNIWLFLFGVWKWSVVGFCSCFLNKGHICALRMKTKTNKVKSSQIYIYKFVQDENTN